MGQAGASAGAVYSGREHYDSLIISTPPFLSSRLAVATGDLELSRHLAVPTLQSYYSVENGRRPNISQYESA